MAGDRLSTVYHRHRRGEVKSTAYDFADADLDLHLLETGEMTGAQAYKRMLAWTVIFEDAGYVLLNRPSSLMQAEYPLPETQSYIEELQKVPLDDLLAATLLDYPTAEDEKPKGRPGVIPPAQKEQTPKRDQTLSIRLTDRQKQDFLDFCRENGLTQSQAFTFLLDQARGDGAYTNMKELLQKKDDYIHDLEQEISDRKKKQAELQKAHTEDLHFIKKQIEQYLQHLYPANPDICHPAPLRALSFRQFSAQKMGHDYNYPNAEGGQVLRLEMLYWGKDKGAPLFVLGTAADGSHIKLRHYPKPDYIGYTLLDQPYAYRDAPWYVGYRQAKDGAMDLVMAMPLDPPQTPAPSAASPKSNRTSRSLADIINEIEDESRRQRSKSSDTDLF